MSVMTCKDLYVFDIVAVITIMQIGGDSSLSCRLGRLILSGLVTLVAPFQQSDSLSTQKCQSISHTVLTFLTTLAAVSEGVRELLPFVRYISQFVEFEFNTIKHQDQGKGVICAATWYVINQAFQFIKLTLSMFNRIMPVALVCDEINNIRGSS
jgi:hypothetical protein